MRRSRRSSRSAAARRQRRSRSKAGRATPGRAADRRPAARLAELFPDDEHPDGRGPRFHGDRRRPRRAGRASSTARWPSATGRTRIRSIAACARPPASTPNSWFRIVGVVEDVRHVSLSRDAGDGDVPADRADGDADLHAGRSGPTGDPASLAPSARAAVQAHRSEPADLRRADDGGSDCGIVRADPRHDAAAARHGGAGGGALRRRDLRIDLVFGQPAHPGDRRAPGARRQPGVGVRRRAAPRRRR